MTGDSLVGTTSFVARGIGFNAKPIEEAAVRGLTSSMVGSADADTDSDANANDYVFWGRVDQIWTSAWIHGCQLDRAWSEPCVYVWVVVRRASGRRRRRRFVVASRCGGTRIGRMRLDSQCERLFLINSAFC
jgi:hypothetical protein